MSTIIFNKRSIKNIPNIEKDIKLKSYMKKKYCENTGIVHDTYKNVIDQFSNIFPNLGKNNLEKYLEKNNYDVLITLEELKSIENQNLVKKEANDNNVSNIQIVNDIIKEVNKGKNNEEQLHIFESQIEGLISNLKSIINRDIIKENSLLRSGFLFQKKKIEKINHEKISLEDKVKELENKNEYLINLLYSYEKNKSSFRINNDIC